MRRRARLLLPAALWLGACAPHDGIDSDLEPSRTLASLSREESVALCDAHDAYLEMMWNDPTWQRQRCVAIAIGLGDPHTVEECEAVVRACLADPDPYEHLDCDGGGAAAPDGCPITVGDVEVCRVDTAEGQRAGGLECAQLGDPDLSMRFADLWVFAPPSCEPLAAPECRPR